MMTEQTLKVVIKMQSKSRFQLESLSGSLPPVLYQRFLAFKRQTQTTFWAKPLVNTLYALSETHSPEFFFLEC